MTVVLADVDIEAVAQLRDELVAAGGVASAVECDVRDADAMQALAERTYRDIGPVRLVVNNAGVEQFGYLWDIPVENWNRLVDINISGVFHGVRGLPTTDDRHGRTSMGVESLVDRRRGLSALAGALHHE